MRSLVVCVCVCVFVWGAGPSSAANILGLFPNTARSVFLISEAVMKGLAARGHNVTVFSCFPQKRPIQNYTDISIRHLREILVSSVDFQNYRFPLAFTDMTDIFLNLIGSMDNLLKSPELKRIISSNTTFDVVFHEMFVDDVFLKVARQFGAPIIALGPSYILPWAADRFAVPQNPSYIPVIGTPYGGRMSFLERLTNAVTYVRVQSLYWGQFLPKSVETYREWCGHSDSDSGSGVSLYLVNTHFTMLGARPYPPQVVEIGGVHVQPPHTLPPDLLKWMDESTDGVIYFCFGSMLRGSTLPAEKVRVFLNVFRRIKLRVLWKWEDEALEEFPDNVKVMKWIPQRDVLAHPAVRVFISHGGLLGSTEAVVSGVPILGIPTNMDQSNNVAALQQAGVAKGLRYDHFTEDLVHGALQDLLTDPSYSEKARQLSRRFLDRPMSPMDTAVYWTEYVIRHRGAPHLRSAAVHLPWYQYYLLDVLALLLTLLTLLIALVYFTVTSCLRRVLPKKSAKLKKN